MNKVMKYAIEIVVIIAILLAALFGISKISPNLFPSKQSQPQLGDKYERKEILVTYEIQKKNPDILSKIKVGDEVFDYNKTSLLGEVVSVSDITPYRYLTKDYDTNSFVLTPLEGLYNRELTASVEADIFEKYIMAGATDLKIGYTIPIISENYLLNGVITKIEILDEIPEDNNND
ncbi:MAG: DUF4330 family protein [Clostridia bacterium]|nr:DUF4330 family protein [Clostridia bacterium]